MELTHDDVLEILAMLERSDVEYLELEVGETRLVADRNGSPAVPGPRADAEGPRARPHRPDPAPTASAPEGETVPSAEEPAQPVPASGAEDLVMVTAPVVGVFYRSPEPGAPPFTEIGAEVAEDSTVGLVEVMKMFNSVTAGVRGHVVEILVDDDAFVEYGQGLMTIRTENAQ